MHLIMRVIIKQATASMQFQSYNSIFKSYLRPLTLKIFHFLGQTSGLQLNGRIDGFNAQSRSLVNHQRMKQKTLSKPLIPTKQIATKNDELRNWGLGSITQTRNSSP